MATPSEKDAALAPAPRRSPRASREQILLLRAGQDRDVATARRVVLGRESGSLALQLILGEQRFPAYEAALLESDGVPVLRWTNLKPIESKTGRLLTLKVAVRVLVEDEYLVRVRGVTKDGRRELDGTYYFQVDR